ncbi:MAG: transglutaminase-like domain-containing protein [Planctomycetota bacterium]
MRRRPKYCHENAYDFFDLAMRAPDGSQRLLAGAVGIALHFLPNHSPAASLEWIEEIAETIRQRVRGPSPEAILAHMHAVLFDDMDFRGNEQDYFHVNNSLLPHVLESHRGLPITLALIYKAVGECLGLTIHGVNSPGHFLVRVEIGEESLLIDPFHSGRLLSPAEAISMIERIVQQPKLPEEEWFTLCNEKQWLQRILNNLRSQLIHTGHSNHVAAMRELHAVLNDEWSSEG